jgi:tetratricopeptide (TPR) repeat protein
MLGGETPYTGRTPHAILAKKLTEPLPRITAVRETVPVPVEAALSKVLARNAVDRFATAAEFSQALAGETVTATSLPPRRRLGPRAAILAVLGLGLVAAGAYGARWFLQTGGPGTVFASGIVNPGDRVLLADFVNRTDDSTLGYAVHEGLRALLSDPRLVRLVDQYSVQAALDRMGLPPYTRLDEQVAREVAERENAKVFITGEITQIGTGYQIVARIVGTADGAELRVERETARSDDEFFDAMDDLGESLRRGIGESVRSALGRPPLPQVTTASLPALRTFATAARLELGGEGNERAIRLLEDAVALDTTFAEAYRWLAAINDNLGHAAEAVRAIDQAYRWRERLPAIERLWIEGDFHALHGDIIAAVDAYQRVLDLDSANGVALVHLSDKRLQQRDYAGAESLARRFLSLGYRWSVGYWNAVEALVSQRRFAAAESVLAPMAPSGVRAQLGIGLLLARRDWAAASEYYSRDALARRECPWCSPLTALVQGRHAEADRLWKAGSNWSTGLSLRWLLYQTRYRSADTARISRELDAFLVRVNWDSLPPERRETWLLVQALAEVGHVAEARQRFAEWKALGPADPRLPEYIAYCEGVIALAEGRLDSAAAAFLRWHAAPFSSATHTFNRGLAEAGDAFDRLGQADTAVVLYEKALTLPTLGGLSYETLWYPFVLRRLGQLHESRGHREQAIDYYSQFIDLWKDADPELQPQVEEARAALARLAREQG